MANIPGYATTETRKAFIESNKETPKDIQETILKGQIVQGMTADQVRASWGKPTEITTSSSGTEMWNYHSNSFLYFYKGKLANWTQTR